MDLKNREVLVTGAGGFIGSHLVERLVGEGCRVRALVHYNSRGDWGNLKFLPETAMRNVEVISGDVGDPFSTRKAVEGCEVVFHLAALIGIPYSYVAPQSYVQTNVIGTLNVLQASLEYRVKRVVHTSTSETYGTALYTPIDEEHPLQGQSPYSASKIGADKIAESYHRSFGLPVVTIRPFNTYGPRQSARAVIPTIISQILSGKKRIVLGSLTPVRDFSFVKDTVTGFVRLAESPRGVGELFNIGSGKGVTVGEIAGRIAEIIGEPVGIDCDPSRVRPENSEVMTLLCSNAKARDQVGWEPEYSLEEGLKETIDFIRRNLDLYKVDIYNL